MQVLSTLDSPNIVGSGRCDVTQEKDGLSFNLFLEYLPPGSLSDTIRNRDQLDEAAIAQYAQQILMGSDYLHFQGIVPHNVKPSNILIGCENCANITDFGCAKWVEAAPAGGQRSPATSRHKGRKLLESVGSGRDL